LAIGIPPIQRVTGFPFQWRIEFNARVKGQEANSKRRSPMPMPLIIMPAQTPRPLNVVGEKITVLASSEQTGGCEFFLQVGPEGSGPPPHNHPWDESFYVIKGEMTLGIDQNEMIAVPGTLVHVPAGATHWFRFGSGGCEMLSITTREGASRLFADIDREISPEKPDPGRLMEIAQRHGLVVVPPGELHTSGQGSKITVEFG
jgi:quercetin dioxygenase-like cupin family protein